MADDVVLIPHTLGESAATTLKAELNAQVAEIDIQVARTPDETDTGFETASILITMGFEDAWYDRLDGIRWVQALSAGVDHIDLDQLEAAGVALTNASGVHADPIAQQVLGYMLVFERNLHRAIRQQSRGVWERFRGGELDGKTLGIIGVGAIGSAVARVCAPFDLEVLGTKRDTNTTIEHVDELLSPARTDEVLAAADYLVLSCPLTESTRELIDAEAFRLMPSDAVLINVARGEVVDESALVTALQQRRIRGAALDVFEEEPLPSDSTLWRLSNAVITPHMAGSTPRYWERCAALVTANYPHVAADELDRLDNRII